MKQIIQFWQQDIINKLIVIVSLLLIGGGVFLAAMIFNMPTGKSFGSAFSDLPIFSLKNNQAVPTFIPPATATPLMLMPPTEFVPPVVAASQTMLALVTPLPETPTASTPTYTPVPPTRSASADCIPGNSRQTATVVEVLDGNTIKVLMDGLVYVVRYIGIAVPENPFEANAARQFNASLVFGREVILVPDQSDKDSAGRLIRYVLAGDQFVNFEILREDFGTVVDVPPDIACSEFFRQAGE